MYLETRAEYCQKSEGVVEQRKARAFLSSKADPAGRAWDSNCKLQARNHSPLCREIALVLNDQGTSDGNTGEMRPVEFLMRRQVGRREMAVGKTQEAGTAGYLVGCKAKEGMREGCALLLGRTQRCGKAQDGLGRRAYDWAAPERDDLLGLSQLLSSCVQASSWNFSFVDV